MIYIQENIQLRLISLSDVKFIYELIDKERNYLREWLPFIDKTIDISFTQAYVENVLNSGQPQYSIYESEKFIGLIGFNNLDEDNRKVEIGYWISEKYQKKGIITHSVKELLKIAFFELNMNSVRIKVAAENLKSRKIPEKLGFTQEGIERAGELLIDDHFTDLIIYSLLKTEYQNKLFA